MLPRSPLHDIHWLVEVSFQSASVVTVSLHSTCVFTTRLLMASPLWDQLDHLVQYGFNNLTCKDPISMGGHV